jgi:ABC-2 type transport system permease protein
VSTSTLELQRVKGPSAVGGGGRRFLNLTWLVATTDFKLTYFGSVLGYIWSFAQPLLFFGVLYLMFAVILSSFTKGVFDFPVLLLMNIVMFNFFQQASSAAVPAVVQRENLVRKMHFPRLVIPLAVVSTAAFQLLLNFVVVLGFMVAYGVTPKLTWLFLPVSIAALMLLTTGVSMLLSALYVRYRDVAPIWSVFVQALFYASPVFITIERVSAKHADLVRYYLFNPIGMILQQTRHWMIGHSPSVGSAMGGWEWVLVPLGLLLGIFVLGYAVFNRMAPVIAEEL